MTTGAATEMVRDTDSLRPPGWWGAFQGILRLTWSSLIAWRRMPGVLALVLANPTLATLALVAADDQAAEAFDKWILHLYAAFMVPIVCLMVGGSMIRDEVQAGTLPFVVTRPLGRARLLLLKYVCQVLWLEFALGLNALLLTVAGMAFGIADAPRMGLWLLGVQSLLIPAFTALSVLLGLISKNYVLLGIVYGFIVEVGIGQIPTNIHTLSLSRHFQALLGHCPAFDAIVPLSAWGVPGDVLAVTVITLAALIAGVVLFSLREYLEAETAQ